MAYLRNKKVYKWISSQPNLSFKAYKTYIIAI